MSSVPEDQRSDTPPYVPPRYLASHPLLNTAQLVSQYHDFRNSLRYISTAPELVFERLVANVLVDIDAARELDKEENANALRTCQLSNSRLKEELEEAKVMNTGRSKGLCTCAAHWEAAKGVTTPGAPVPVKILHRLETGVLETGKKPATGRLISVDTLVGFTKPYTVPPIPSIGLWAIDISNTNNARVKAYVSQVGCDSMQANIETWGGTVLQEAGCTWLLPASDDPDFQSGCYDTLDDHPRDQPDRHKSHNISFTREFSAPPVVVVWLAGLDMDKCADWRIKTFATNITATGFTIHIDTWEDSILYSAVASWFAYTVDRPGICSGRFTALGISERDPSQLHSSGNVKFAKNIFDAPPRTVVALDSFHLSRDAPLRVLARISETTADGMNWHVERNSDMLLCLAGASYIAFS